MIYTVTLNPAIDRTIQLTTLIPATLNVVEKSMTNIGGKGINVSMVLKALGCDSVALGMAGGENGRYIKEELTKAGVRHFFLDTGKEVRTNTKIMERDGTLTELNEKGAGVESELVTEFTDEVSGRLKENDILVLSGSVPSGVPVTIYADLINVAHSKGAKVILDADGELFAKGVEAEPDVIKPNIDELRRYLAKEGFELKEEKIFASVNRVFNKSNISKVILSMGNKGAYFFDMCSDERLYYDVVPVEVKSTVGAGDSMVAAWTYAMEKGYTFEESASLAMAASAAAVETPGTMAPSIERIKEIKSGVIPDRK